MQLKDLLNEETFLYQNPNTMSPVLIEKISGAPPSPIDEVIPYAVDYKIGKLYFSLIVFNAEGRENVAIGDPDLMEVLWSVDKSHAVGIIPLMDFSKTIILNTFDSYSEARIYMNDMSNFVDAFEFENI